MENGYYKNKEFLELLGINRKQVGVNFLRVYMSSSIIKSCQSQNKMFTLQAINRSYSNPPHHMQLNIPISFKLYSCFTLSLLRLLLLTSKKVL